jgi:hypothetical protein
VIDVSVLDMLQRYFPQETPEYNQYSDDDSVMVQRAKAAAQARAAQSEPYFPQNLNTGGYQMGMPSNQERTLNKLDAYAQWADSLPQQGQKKSYGPWDALGQIANAYARSQQQGAQPSPQSVPQPTPQAPAPNGMQVGAGIPSILDALIQNRGGI